ncbi:hypothetical protein [Steroidobacter agaridevorans]|uniref:hypothetical protein n=1 Tax=Steroidobacter agaridevorans TaxID=2695856 RepID=UPI0013206F66|nr:hypothetical protein [Steroidobacter agaridevorans]GFE90442.1 hypothetical protein GCM10011488_53960 [Steroidobacter agaridevorans]
MKVVSFSLEEGNKYFGRIDGKRFYIGSRVPYLGGKGLANSSGTALQKYDRRQFRDQYGFWADFIHPTAMAEGALFHTLNTYDRAFFTFSFLQFAAHVPNGDFVVYMRALLKLPSAAEYFPDLAIVGDRICRLLDSGPVQLESDVSTAGLCDYLNPTVMEIEDTEVIQAAKFVHWAQNDALNRQMQIEVGIAHFRRNMAQYAQRYSLDGAPAAICLVIADIRHQGRAKSAAIVSALANPKPLDALLDLGSALYPERVKVLRREIKALTTEGTFGGLKYSVAKSEFVN